jgi:ATP-dependent Clp protease protease subunit
MREQLNQILSRHTGQSVERIRADSDRDFWMNAQDAKQYGLIDIVQEPRNTVDRTLGRAVSR